MCKQTLVATTEKERAPPSPTPSLRSSSSSTSSSDSSTASPAPILASEKESQRLLETSGAVATKVSSPTHSSLHRNTKYDWLIFLGPLLFYNVTPIYPLYAIAVVRLLMTHLVLSLHWQFVDKDNYQHKLTQQQIERESDEYMSAFFMHMYIQIALQLIFPASLFFSPHETISASAGWVLAAHVLVVEPIYYAVHRWLHVPAQMKRMHGFHHLSINTLPTTSLCQNPLEHLVYVATFGPAFLLPWLMTGQMHWTVIGAYLVMFDMVNAWGHTNVRLSANKLSDTIWNHPYSPLRYLLYTPEFHQGHHSYFTANYTLFMPIWDYLFGTARPYKKAAPALLPAEQQNFVFIGHNGGFGHLFTIPELCFYNVYKDYKIYLPIKLEFMLMHGICLMSRLVMSFYYCSRFCINNDTIGRIIVLIRSPWDYMHPTSYNAINHEIVALMRQEHKKSGTRYFGLGNLNKMKQLNEGGVEIVRLVKEDSYLRDKNIRVWTGDTMTVASVYHQIADIPNLESLYYIGAGGKVGTAVCEMLAKSHPDLKIRIFSRHQYLTHYPNITYSTDLSDIRDYKVVLAGKILSPKMYKAAFDAADDEIKTRFILDYTVPALPIPALKKRPHIKHIRVGLLKTHQNNPFLRGHYDLCMSHPENHIVPCHFGCLLNTIKGRESDEVGEIDQDDVEQLWKMGTERGFNNTTIDYSE